MYIASEKEIVTHRASTFVVDTSSCWGVPEMEYSCPIEDGTDAAKGYVRAHWRPTLLAEVLTGEWVNGVRLFKLQALRER